MSLLTRAEEALKSHFEAAVGVGDTRLQAAMAHAVFAGGARIRPNCAWRLPLLAVTMRLN
jgi:geranylgeranyl diphosphate synthase type II